MVRAGDSATARHPSRAGGAKRDQTVVTPPGHDTRYGVGTIGPERPVVREWTGATECAGQSRVVPRESIPSRVRGGAFC